MCSPINSFFVSYSTCEILNLYLTVVMESFVSEGMKQVCVWVSTLFSRNSIALLFVLKWLFKTSLSIISGKLTQFYKR